MTSPDRWVIWHTDDGPAPYIFDRVLNRPVDLDEPGRERLLALLRAANAPVYDTYPGRPCSL